MARQLGRLDPGWLRTGQDSESHPFLREAFARHGEHHYGGYRQCGPSMHSPVPSTYSLLVGSALGTHRGSAFDVNASCRSEQLLISGLPLESVATR
jgi:hypothetical protein